MRRLALILALATCGWLAASGSASARWGCGGGYYGRGYYPSSGGNYYRSYYAPSYGGYYGGYNTYYRPSYGGYYGGGYPYYGGGYYGSGYYGPGIGIGFRF